VSTEENKAIVRRLYEELYEKRNIAVVDEVFAPDYVRHMAFVGWQTSKLRGTEVYRNDMKHVWPTFPDLTVTVEQMIAEDDKVVTIAMLSGTQMGDEPGGPCGAIKATGRRVTVPIAIVSRLSEGEIVEDWESDNFGSFWQQLGAIPTPGQPVS